MPSSFPLCPPVNRNEVISILSGRLSGLCVLSPEILAVDKQLAEEIEFDLKRVEEEGCQSSQHPTPRHSSRTNGQPGILIGQ